MRWMRLSRRNVAGVRLGWRILQRLDLPRGPGLLLLGMLLWFYVFLDTSTRRTRCTCAARGSCALGWSSRDGATSSRPVGGVTALRDHGAAGRAAGDVRRAARGARCGGRGPRPSATGGGSNRRHLVRGAPGRVPGRGVGRGLNWRGRRVAPARGRGEHWPVAIGVPGCRSGVSEPVQHRSRSSGAFLWTPATAFAVVGFVLLACCDLRHRWFLIGLGVCRAALHPLDLGNFWAATRCRGSWRACSRST